MDALLIHASVVESVKCAIRLGWGGASIRQATSKPEALQRLAERKPDLIVIDDSLPDACALALTAELRSLTDAVIVIITREYDDYQLAAAVDAGADDYFPVPVNPAVFVPRMRAATRRAGRLSDSLISVGRLSIDPSRYQVQIAGQEVHLPASEFKVLLELARLHGRVATRDQLASAIWGEERDVYGAWLGKYIQSLRRRICSARGSDIDIITVPKVGYKLITTEDAHAEEMSLSPLHGLQNTTLLSDSFTRITR
jgi:DNA-binding response OmpR family regulator